MVFLNWEVSKLLSYEVFELLSYWQSIGGGERVPEKSQLDLRLLKSILPWMFILEMSKDGALRYRLAGSALEEAIGRGMTGQIYGEVFASAEQAAMMEELHAVSLVQSSGLLRIGSFNLSGGHKIELEVVTLPFQDTRVMGGVILVGVVAPFEFQNQGFIDHWGEFDQRLSTLLTVGSPRLLTYHQLSKKVQLLLKKLNVELMALDTEKLLALEASNKAHLHAEVPVLDLTSCEEQPSN